jgi:hypothetical protein
VGWSDGAGEVFVFYGNSGGLATNPEVVNQRIRQENVGEKSEKNDGAPLERATLPPITAIRCGCKLGSDRNVQTSSAADELVTGVEPGDEGGGGAVAQSCAEGARRGAATPGPTSTSVMTTTTRAVARTTSTIAAPRRRSISSRSAVSQAP